MSTFTNNNVASGDVVRASDHNTQGANIASVVNGNIEADNLASNAVTTAKIADNAVTPEKRAGGFKVGTLSTSVFGATGSKAVTGIGFTPKYIEIDVFLDTSAAGASRDSRGWSDGTTTRSRGVALDAPAGTSARYNSSTLVNARNEANVSQVTATFTSFDADGFTMNVTVANSGYSAVYRAYA